MEMRIALVDDDPNMHLVVTKLLESTDDIRLIGQAYRGEDALALCRQTRPDIVLMDVKMPGIGGAAATRILNAECPWVKVVVFSSYHEYEFIKELLDSGAIGYLVKDAVAEELSDTLRAIYQGNMVFSPEAATAILNPDFPLTDFGLTQRELEVLRLMADGRSNGQIAHDLSISVPTVRFHTANLLEKMRVGTRSEALVLAVKSNLL